MKKLFLLFFVTFLSSTSYVFGQGNTYNMVIKMSNGSTITLGSNDVESMTFNNGIITVSGINLDELINKLSEMSSSDVVQIRNEIDELTKAIQMVQGEIQKGVIISSVTQISDGIQIALSNGQVYAIHSGRDGMNGKDANAWTIGEDGYWYMNGVKTEYRAVGYNGKDGKDSDVWAIGGDGYWYKNGVKTEYRAVGYNGKDGKDSDVWAIGGDGYWYKNGVRTEFNAVGHNGKNGLSYVPNTETGCFDIYQDGSFVEHTNINYLSNTSSSDINNLQAQIDGLRQTINNIQEIISNGYYIVGVSQVSNGISITLNDGKTYIISSSSPELEARIKALEEKVQQLSNK